MEPTILEGQDLPAGEIADEVNTELRQSSQLIVTAPPGAGKSTLLPLTMLQSLEGDGKILMLEPRRLAARQIAERMATMIGENVGQTVGYRVRFEQRVSRTTKIEVLTEGILTRRLTSDPTLEGVSAVIFDEFHERSLVADVALALTREAQQIVRPDLKIVIMSATIDTSALSALLGAKVVMSRGRMYPVEIRHGDECDQWTVCEVAAHAVREAHGKEKGDILVFLPGEGEIRRTMELLDGSLGATHIYPLYGMLPHSEQRKAIQPSRPGERKVVLATSIAETSLTIEGVRVVIDSGLCRQMRFDARSGLSRLETVRISKDMAEQRAGRAGRLEPGVCYRLWTKATDSRLKERRTPEIEDADLAPMLLDIALWGESQLEQMAWLTPPPPSHVGQAKNLLNMLGAIGEDGKVTPHGRRLGEMPCHPRIAQMLTSCSTNNSRALAADIAALLEERDPMAKRDGRPTGTDIGLRIDALRQARSTKKLGGTWGRIERIASQYRQLVGANEDNEPFSPTDAGCLIAEAFPERIASARPGKTGLFMLSEGSLAQMDHDDDLAHEAWLAIANMDAREGLGRIFLASPLDPQDLRGMLTERDNISWDMKTGKVVAQKEFRIGRLVLGSRPIADGRRDEIDRVICEAAKKDGERMLDFSDDVAALQARVSSVSAWHPELDIVDISTATVLSNADEWLPMYIGKSTSVGELKKIDLSAALWNMIPYAQQQQIERLAPTHISVPSGSRIKIDYRPAGETPVVHVRLQECFGLAETPRVDDGRQQLLMELLSPGFKPVQLTQDLHSFWENTYFEVKKELKRRYPKHSWPDDPWKAEAIRGTRRKEK